MGLVSPLPVAALNSELPVVIIDSDRNFCAFVASQLAKFGCQIRVVATESPSLDEAVLRACGAIVLGVTGTGVKAFDLLKQIRQSSAVPILILAEQADEAHEIAGLECGADDFLPKHASVQRLLARLRAITRRAVTLQAAVASPAPVGEITVEELRITPSARKVVLGDRTLSLTMHEYDILLALVRAKGSVKTRDHLFSEICNREYGIFDRTLDMQISALRRKLGDNARRPRFIHTVRSIGYMFGDPSTTSHRTPCCRKKLPHKLDVSQPSQ